MTTAALDTWLAGVRLQGLQQSRADAPTVLMVHGGGQAGWAYEHWLPAFAAWGWTACAVSLRGHEPQASLPPEVYCKLHLRDYRDDVLRAIDHLAPQRLVLLGHSLGGMVCQLVAEARLPAGLVLVSSAGPPELGVRRSLLDPDTPVVRSPQEARERYFHSASDTEITRALARLVPESPGALNASGGRTAVDVSRITCPVLAISGNCDRTDVPRASALATLYGGTALELADTGHNVMQERSAPLAAQCIHAWSVAQGIGPRPA